MIPPFHQLLLLLFPLLLVPPLLFQPPAVVVVVSEPIKDGSALLSFYSRILHSQRLQWNTTTSTCQWRGITCNSANTSVIALRLPGMALVGPIPPGTISLLSNLQVLSLRSNRLSGQIPHDLGNLTRLRALYLQHNGLSGHVPPEISKLTRLRRLNFSDNDLNGGIPANFNNLTALKGMFLEKNNFTGEIPAIDIPSLVGFNVSYNRLGGPIPTSLSRFPASSFAGNLNLCGGPLPAPCSSFPAPPPGPPPPGHKRKLSTTAIISISVVGGVILLLIILIFVVCVALRRRRRSKNTTKTTTATTVSSKDDASGWLGDVEERNKLVFLENRPYSFDLEDLLRASAEVLGKGSLGTSYKALLEDGASVVVKRLKDVVATKREFEQQTAILCRAKHDNIVPLRAYYYSKDEKLLVYDYHDTGSLSALLHGDRASSRAALDWNRRVRVALAVARGIFHLHSSKLVHGDVKASNVLLQKKPEAAALSDSGLWVLFRKAAVARAGAGGGYRAPELAETGKPTVESDVYSFGVVLLELLTGRAANQAVMVEEEAIDLPRWVRSVVSEEWTGEVFEAELVRYEGAKGEEAMLQVLQISMACVAVAPEGRPGIKDVVVLLEEVVRKTESSDEPSKDPSGAPSP